MRRFCDYKILLLLPLLFALCGCKTKYITTEVPVVMHDSVNVVSIETRTDTLWQNTEVRITDTLWLDTSTVATLGMPVLHHDRTTEKTSDKGKTSTSTKSDTIFQFIEKPVPVKITEVLEVNRLYWWQSALMWCGIASAAVTAIIIYRKLSSSFF